MFQSKKTFAAFLDILAATDCFIENVFFICFYFKVSRGVWIASFMVFTEILQQT